MKRIVLGLLLVLSGAASVAATGGGTAASTLEMQDALAKLRQIQKDNEADLQGTKGWTCRDMSDGGRRMHRVDLTGSATMNGVPSSHAGLTDNTTPLSALPACAEPR
ncbi:hypothetical protein [Bordetella trematum]|uniref:hypothetical protein n=1 Tax=Bordetella trematum TaxID=123899 RepID=UPI000D89ECF6|nr:hypothetical protein [Bordetella trematum]SPU50531.1 Uncharacterised protein [Bordetella trematum]VDH06769.1 Uncharacterised protein [Bordetella trematum]